MKFFSFAYCLSTVTLLMVCGNRLLAAENAGFKLGNGDIISVFQLLVTNFTGECPGSHESGTARDGGIRFISFSTLPSADLKVRLINTNTGKAEVKTYANPKGSNKLTLRNFGNRLGSYEVSYEIFSNTNKSVIESGKFSYIVQQDQIIRERNAWNKSVQYCQDPLYGPLDQCKKTFYEIVKNCS